MPTVLNRDLVLAGEIIIPTLQLKKPKLQYFQKLAEDHADRRGRN